MIKSDGNGSLIIKKTTLIPLSLVILLIAFVVSASGFYYGLKHEVSLNTMHRISEDVHQPFEEKLETWLTRTEGEEMKLELKHLLRASEDMQRKIDVLIERTEYLAKEDN